MTFSAHLPLWSIEPSTPSTPVREGPVDAIINYIHTVEKLDPEIFILHATGTLAADFYRIPLPELSHNYFFRQFQKNVREGLLKILSETRISNHCLAIETIAIPI